MKRKALSLLLALTLCVGLAAPAMAATTVFIKSGTVGELEGGGYGGILVDGWELTNVVSTDVFYLSDYYKEHGVECMLYYAESPASLTSLWNMMRQDYAECGVYSFSGSLTEENILPDNLLASGLLSPVEPTTLGDDGKIVFDDGIEWEFDYPAGSVYILEEGVYFLLDELVAGCSMIVVGNAQTAPAPDAPSDWAAETVSAAIAAGLVPDALQSKYTNPTTRAEFCALAVALYETVKGAEITERSTFSDSTDVNVQKMAGLKVVNGIGDGKFGPENKLTREQAATMLSRLADAIGKPLTDAAPTFNDSAEISDWALDAVGRMQVTGVMGGVGDNTFSPGTDYTREQSILTIMRLFDIVK